MTLKRKTHFEQVSVEVIKEVIAENARQEKIRTDLDLQVTNERDTATDLLEAVRPTRGGKEDESAIRHFPIGPGRRPVA
jgi:hypothetical protein